MKNWKRLFALLLSLVMVLGLLPAIALADGPETEQEVVAEPAAMEAVAVDASDPQAPKEGTAAASAEAPLLNGSAEPEVQTAQIGPRVNPLYADILTEEELTAALAEISPRREALRL